MEKITWNRKQYSIIFSLLFSILSVGINIEIFKELFTYNLFSIMLFIIFFFLIYYFLFLIRKYNSKISDGLFGILIGILIATSSYFNMDNFSKLLFIVLSCYGFYKIIPLFINQQYKKYIPTKFHLVVLILITLYATFACTYNQIITSTIPSNINISTFYYVLLFFVFWVMLALLFLLILNNCQRKMVAPAIVLSKKDKGILWLKVFFIILICYTFWVIASYPANTMWDGVVSWWQSNLIGKEPLVNEHPIIYAMLIRFCTYLIDSPFMIVLFQTLVQAAIWASGALLLYNRGVSRKTLYVMAFLVGIMPNNGINTATMLKDMAFAVSVLGLVVCLGHLANDEKKELTISQCFLFVVAFFFVCFLRHDGIAAVIPTIIILIIFWWRNKSVLYVSIITLTLIFLTKFFIFPFLEIRSHTPNKYAVIIHTVGSVFYYDGTIKPTTEAYFTENVSKEKWKAHFKTYYWDSYVVPNVYVDSNEQVSVLSSVVPQFENTTKELYMHLFNLAIDNPKILIKKFLDISESNWAVFQGIDPSSYNYKYTLGIQESVYDYFPSFNTISQKNELTDIADNILNISVNIKFLDIFLWRGGIYIILFLILSYYAWLKNKFKNAIIFVPLLCRFIPLLIFSVAQAYRYVYSVFLVFPFVFLYIISINNSEQKLLKERKEY